MYFSNCDSVDCAKALYRKLAVKLHPDKGGEHEIFVAMQNEYEAFLSSFGQTKNQIEDDKTFVEEFIRTHSFFATMNGVTVELTGLWIWVSGNTYPHKDVLKEQGFLFSSNKKRWYKDLRVADGEKMVRSGRGRYSFDKIKSKYGYSSVSVEETVKYI